MKTTLFSYTRKWRLGTILSSQHCCTWGISESVCCPSSDFMHWPHQSWGVPILALSQPSRIRFQEILINWPHFLVRRMSFLFPLSFRAAIRLAGETRRPTPWWWGELVRDQDMMIWQWLHLEKMASNRKKMVSWRYLANNWTNRIRWGLFTAGSNITNVSPLNANSETW